MDYNQEVLSKKKALTSITKKFILMWMLTGIGMAIGSMLPVWACLLMSLSGILLIILTIFIKDNKIANKIFLSIPFLSGTIFYYVISKFIDIIGVDGVLGVLLLTVLLFFSLGFVGYVVIKRDLGNMGAILLLALFILITFSFVALLFPSEILSFVLTVFGVILFSLFTIYDFNQIRNNDITEEDTTQYALNLYLDFLNLFTKLLDLTVDVLFDNIRN